MRLVLQHSKDPETGAVDLAVQAEWQTVKGDHRKRVTEDMPEDVRAAAETLSAWSESIEAGLADEIVAIKNVQEIDRRIALLNEAKKHEQKRLKKEALRG